MRGSSVGAGPTGHDAIAAQTVLSGVICFFLAPKRTMPRVVCTRMDQPAEYFTDTRIFELSGCRAPHGGHRKPSHL